MTRTERQKSCIKRWLQAGGIGTIEAATGFGKTRMALLACKTLVSKISDARILIVVPTQVLKDQWLAQIDKWGLSMNAHVEIINTVIKQRWDVDLLCVDECHRCGSDTFVNVFTCVDYKYILCLTGTMERLDMRHLLIERYAPICDRVSIEEAELNGWVAPHKEYVVMLDVDLSEYKELNKKFNNAFSFFGFQFDDAMRCSTDVRYRARWAKENHQELKVVTAMAMTFMRTMRNRKDFIQNHPKKLEIARKILNARPNAKCITFSPTIAMAEKIGIGMTMHSKKKAKENAEILEKFNSMECGVLNTSKSADEGLDCKGINLEVILHTDSSKIRKKQRVGRAIRFEEGKTAEIFTLIVKGTQEVTWFANSKVANVITINESQLDDVLAGKEVQSREREYVENKEFRF